MTITGESEATHPYSDCLNLGQSGTRWIDDLLRVAPLMALDDVADGHRCCCVSRFEVALIRILHRLELLNHLSCFLISAALQISVDQIVHCMEFFTRITLLMG